MKRRFHDLLEYTLERASELGFRHSELLAANVCTSHAHWHVLGFVEVVLLSTARETLRLHLWRNVPASEPIWRVHDHSYDLRSLVVAGRLQDQRYRVVPDSGGKSQLYRVSYGPKGSKRIKLEQRVRCIEMDRLERGTDQTYRIPVGTFHSTVLATGCSAAITVVQTGRSTNGPPRVVGTVDGAEAYDYVTRKVNSVTLDEWSRFIIDELRLW